VKGSPNGEIIFRKETTFGSLKQNSTTKPQEPSIIFRNERNEESSLSWQELCDQVSILQQWLIRNGVGKGDVVAGYLPYLPETVERLGQVNPKILFCCDGYSFNGKTFDMSEKNRKIAEQLPDLLNICEIEYLESGIIYERVPFNSPLFILYSSGTTGKPKCIIHTVGGTIINHLKEHQLHCDIQPDDRVFYYTTCYPEQSVLWDMVDDCQVTLFGTSAKYLEAIQHAHYEPALFHDLSTLKTICSTGSVLYPEQFDFVYSSIKSDVHLATPPDSQSLNNEVNWCVPTLCLTTRWAFGTMMESVITNHTGASTPMCGITVMM